MNVGDNGQENFTITIDDSQARSQAQQTAQSFANIGREAEAAGQKMDNAVGKMGSAASDGAKGVKKLNEQLDDQQKKLSELDSLIAKYTARQEDYKKKLSDLQRQYQLSKQSQGEFAEGTKTLKAMVDEMTGTYNRASATLDHYKSEKQRASKTAEQLKGAIQNEASGISDAAKSIRNAKQETEGFADVNNSLLKTLKNVGFTVAGGMGLKELASKVVEVRSDFESMETSLGVLLGGDKGRLNDIMGQIKDYALASPLNTKDMVGAVQMMTSFGIEAEKSIDYLKAIGDISMGDSGKFNSLALAFSQMSSAGKLMGQDLMQMVNAGFNPLEEISRKTGKSIGELKNEMSSGAITSKMVQDAFISATSAGGKFYGMASEGAKTLRGQLSMLGEQFDLTFNEIGTKAEPIILNSVKAATSLVENYKQVGMVLTGLVTAFGIYRTAVAIATVATNGYTIAETLAYTRMLLLEKATKLLNITMLANPYVAAAAALGTLIGVMIAANDGLTDIERAQKAYNDRLAEARERQEKYNEETQRAIDTATSDASATNERKNAMNLLISRYPSIIKKYIDEEGHLRDILGLKREIAAIDGQKVVHGYYADGSTAKRAERAFAAVQRAKRQAIQGGFGEGQYTQFLSPEEKKEEAFANDWYERNAKPSWYHAGSTEERLGFANNIKKLAFYTGQRRNAANKVKNYQDQIAGMSNTQLKQMAQNLKKLQGQIGGKGQKKYVRLTYKGLSGALLSQSDLKNLSTLVDGASSARQNSPTYRQSVGSANKDYQAAQSELKRLLNNSKATAGQVKAARDKVKAASDKISELTGTSPEAAAKDATRAAKKQASEAEKAKKKGQRDAEKAAKDAEREAEQAAQLREKSHTLQEKWDKEDADTHLKAIQARTEADLAAENNAHEKELNQLKNNHEKELQQINQQEEDYKKSNFQRAKEKWDLTNKDKKRTFYDTKEGKDGWQSQKLTDDQSKAIQAAIEKENKAYEKTVNESERKVLGDRLSSLNDYLEQYGTFQQQKLAIATKYAKQIADVQASADDADTKKWKIAKLHKDEEKEKAEVDSNAILAKIDWYTVFGNVGGILKGSLEPLLKSLNEYTSTKQFQQLGADKQKTILDAMENIRGQVGTNSDVTWKDLASDLTTYQDAVRKAAEAENEHQAKIEEYSSELDTLTKKLKDAEKSGDVSAMSAISKQMADINDKMTESGLRVTEANQEVTQSANKLSKTTKNVIKPIDDIHVFLQTVGLSDLQTLWDSFNSLKGAADGLKALNKAAKASKELGESATQAADGAKELGEVITDAGQQTATALVDVSKNVTDAADKISGVVDKVSDAAAKTGEAVTKAGAAAGQVAGVVGDALSKGLSKAGLIGQIIAAILKILDVLKDGIGPIVSSLIDSILGAVAGIINNILSGKFVTQIIGSLVKGIGNILSSIVGNLAHILSFGAIGRDAGNWFKNSNADEINKRVKALEESNDRLKSSIDKLKNTLESRNGMSAVKTYDDAREKMQKVISQTMDIVHNKMDYHDAHHSNASRWSMGEDRYAQINDLINKNRGNYNELATMYDVHSLEDIYKLSPEQMDDIRKNLFDVWDEITHTGRYNWSEQWNNYADLSGQYDELKKTFREKLTGISFDSMRNNFVDNLMDMSKKASDWTKDLNKMFAKSLLNFAIGTEMDDKLRKWWTNWADVIKKQNGDLSQSQIDGMRQEYEGFISEGKTIRDRVFKVTGADKEAYSQDSSKSVLQGVTQDQIQEINGRLTSIQINVDKNQQNTTDIKALMDDFADLQVKGLEHLEKIVKYTSELPEMNKKLEKIRQNTEHL